MTDSSLPLPSIETSSIECLAESYDYIIVGGGTSGLVIASRLTEDPNVTVLVLEAGSDKLHDSRITTPGLAVAMWDDPQFDWQFMTTPQDELNGRTVAHPRGKTLGGSSAINVGLMAYPSKSGLDSWEKLGNKGWNFDTLRPYYRKFHTYTPPSKAVQELLALDYMDQSVQGTTGPIQVSFGDFQGQLQKQWPETFKRLNMKYTGDPLTGLGFGGHSNPASIHPKSKTRSHAGTGYYDSEVRKRVNLRVLSEALVEKVILKMMEDGHVSAKGVQFSSKAGKGQIVNVNKEVILSAGAFQSPQLLELSGIGSRNLLERLGIETVVDNPFVGENLQDHAMACISFEVEDDIATADVFRDPKIFNAAIDEYNKSKTGFLTSGTYCSAFMPIVDFLKHDGQAELSDLLDQYLPNAAPLSFPAQKQQYDLLRAMLQSKDDSSIHYCMALFQINVEAGSAPSKCFSPITEGNYVTLLVALSHPFSRGSVHITSADARDKPVIDPKYLSHPLDNEILARHVQYMETLIRTEPLASLLKKDGRRIPADVHVETLEEARKLGPRTVTSNFHPTGTCAMMPKELGGVVDERLIVHGTTNLRVVDASIIPLEPRGNIQSSVFAIAERASDLIKEAMN
ncbi:MAG: hypothetical protein L6R38_006771 [Xanthoria sp. 2 TBL-2021]|nr:MAG: hypothetical protein L6R38_006771 [Xanthoria sp. 2 TBL-2021]